MPSSPTPPEIPAYAAARAAVADPARLAAVRATGLLDADEEEAFDRLTRLAVRLAGAPAAFVSLVDENRDFYLSACGVGEPLASARELTGPTFCHYAVQGREPLVIPDTAADPAWRHVPTVTSLGVAAYVGVPLVVDGHPVGALCVIDTRPHAWTPNELEVLVELAASAERELELRVARTRAERLAARFDRQAAELALRYDAVAAQATSAHALTAELESANARLHEAAAAVAERDAAAEAERGRALSILETISDAFFALDREWRFTYVNDRAEQVLFRRREELLGRSVWDEFREAVGSTFDVEYRRAMTTGERAEFEQYYPPLDTWFAVRAYPGPDGLAVYFQDVNERHRAEAALEESERRLRTVQDASPDGSLLARAVRDEGGALVDFVFVYANAAAARILFGEEDAPIVGRRLREAFPAAVVEGRLAAYAEVVASGETWQEDVYHRLVGAERGLRVTAVRVDDGVHIALVDLTERLRVAAERERALAAAEAARAEAEAANAVKAQFLATMSHELRTPLNAIGGYAQLMELGVRGAVTPEQAADLARIRMSQQHLLGLINSVLNYAKLEAGQVQYASERVPLGATVRAVETLVAPQLRARGLAFTVAECDDAIAALADEEKVRQVLLNLLTNAVKFTPAGGRVTVRCEQGAPGRVRVVVADTGVGIPSDKLEAVFDPFVQVDARLTRTHEGTGLGLAISRDLARGMGGELRARSVEGEGSEFELELGESE